MSGGWLACLVLVLLAQYCWSNADQFKPMSGGVGVGVGVGRGVASDKQITPSLPVKKGDAARKSRNFNPFVPFYNPDPQQQLAMPTDYTRQNPFMQSNPFMQFNPFLYFNPAMLMMLLNPQQNAFNPLDAFRAPNTVVTVSRTVTSTAVIQTTIYETTTQTSVTPFLETTTVIIPSTSTSTIIIPVYSTEVFIVRATSTSTIVVPEYSTTTILAYTDHNMLRRNYPGPEVGEAPREERNHRKARLPNNF